MIICELMSELTAILYRSEASASENADDLRDILSKARAHNPTSNITGILHFESGVFYQWIEGPQEAVRALFEKIIQDPRHKGIVKLSEVDLTERNFRFWSMAICQGDGYSLFDWAARAGISLHLVKPEEILSFLLSCARHLPRDQAA